MRKNGIIILGGKRDDVYRLSHARTCQPLGKVPAVDGETCYQVLNGLVGYLQLHVLWYLFIIRHHLFLNDYC